jgi:hypothetical protein
LFKLKNDVTDNIKKLADMNNFDKIVYFMNNDCKKFLKEISKSHYLEFIVETENYSDYFNNNLGIDLINLLKNSIDSTITSIKSPESKEVLSDEDFNTFKSKIVVENNQHKDQGKIKSESKNNNSSKFPFAYMILTILVLILLLIGLKYLNSKIDHPDVKNRSKNKKS